METHNIMSFKAILLLLLFSIVLAKADLDSSTILKTIVSGNETIDCVDIYRQPAFNHPLLKDHVIQLEPSSYPDETKSRVPRELTQLWHKNGEYCPNGTVPILRSPTNIPPENNTSDVVPNANFPFSKDFKTSHWWLLTGRTGIGYWPARLVKNLSKKNIVRQLEYGGKVTKSKDNTIVEMGNGHFPGEGFGKAAFFFNLEYVDGKNYWSKVPDDVFVYVSRPDCYDLKMQNWDVDYGTSFLYGGPGTACRRKDDSPERSAAAAVGAVGV
ncbi:hypothetical protein LINPERPRIM_LOCUS26985 [Linum perenne]